jgi:hypothetical protein
MSVNLTLDVPVIFVIPPNLKQEVELSNEEISKLLQDIEEWTRQPTEEGIENLKALFDQVEETVDSEVNELINKGKHAVEEKLAFSVVHDLAKQMLEARGEECRNLQSPTRDIRTPFHMSLALSRDLLAPPPSRASSPDLAK